MHLNPAMSVVSVAEILLWATAGLLFWKKGLGKRFPAMGAYLGLHVVSAPVLAALLYFQEQPWGAVCSMIHFFAYWAVYIASAVLVFLICIEIFRAALSPFPGLIKFGIIVFRWTVVVSLIVSFSAGGFHHHWALLLAGVSFVLMRSVSILELSLLIFLCLSKKSLRLTIRDIPFGMALGFGLMSVNDFVFSILSSAHTPLSGPLQLTYHALILTSLGVWLVYYALPEPVRKPLMMPVNSAIYRWNEIASALGHTGTQVAVQQPANSFFLTDVEKVVEKVITRNLKGRQSEL
jgi:hypothetical protein